MTKTALLAASAFILGLPIDARAETITLVSDPTWTVTDANGLNLGTARDVCLNASSPNCPAGAILYGYPLLGWTANLSSIPGATWIWAPNVTGATTPAQNAEFTFQREFYLCGAPQGGTVFVAADDHAEVYVNGEQTPSLTSTGHSSLTSAAIPAAKLTQGLNIIKIRVRNGLNPPDCGSGEYRCNPAGFVFGASFVDALTTWPTCTKNNGQVVKVGQSETLSCPTGQTGTASRTCICLGNNGLWWSSSTCAVPPPVCIGHNGTVFNVGASETLSCPPGMTGSASRTCQSSGSWGPTNTASCVPPPVSCTAPDGTKFSVGGVQTRPCPPGYIGSILRSCQPDGSWSPETNNCRLPQVGVGEICGNSSQGYTATCPIGTECGSRLLPVGPRPWYCVIFGIDCPVRLKTSDWYCDP